MTKKVFLFSLTLIMVLATTAAAQDQMAVDPLLQQGVKELGLRGDIDLEGTQGDIDVNLTASYGYFYQRDLELGIFGNFSRVLDGDIMSYSVGVFGEYHLFGSSMVGFARTVPYLGADLGLAFLDTDFENEDDESALVFVPRVGIKWFFRDYVAVDTNVFLALASDDIYINDGDADPYDVGINIGLRVYFQ
jgi:hypothetical protein